MIGDTDAVLHCLVYDLDRDRTLASAGSAGSTLQQADLEAAVRTGKELFRGKYAERFVQSLATGLISARGFVREAQITNGRNHQFMAAVPGRDDLLLAVFTDQSLTLGLGWMAIHQAQDLLAESLGVDLPAQGGQTDSGEAPPAPEPPTTAANDPKPVPPPGEDAEPQPLPNPLAKRWRNS